jgi:hypothetical protein
MRRYSQDQEERIRAQSAIREWTRSGLLDPAQRARLEAELRVDVRRTNDFLRAALALFAAIIVGASVLFVTETFDVRDASSIAAVTGAAALVCFGLAELLVGRFRVYRFGVEEALAAAAVLLLSVSGAHLVQPLFRPFGPASMITRLLIGAAGGFGLYRRFGFVYAAVAGMACAALIPFELNLPGAAQHALSAATLAAVFFVVRSRRLRYGNDYPGDEYGQLQAAAWAGIYLVLNLKIGWSVFWRPVDGWFYWCTYAVMWLLPIAGLYLSIREKDRMLLYVGIATSLATLVTNKPYLGWPRHTWDPILLGVFLMAVAIAVRRWLSSGLGGERNGFTPAQVLTKDSRVLTLLRAASTAYQPDTSSVRNDSASPGFDGGRSGGGGGGATY